MRRVALALAIAVTGCASVEAPIARYSNPVLDAEFADPAVVRAADGFFYAVATQGRVDGRQYSIQLARSSDLVSWQRLGDALPEKPVWARRTQDFWAPDISVHEGRYFLYFSAKPDAALEDKDRGLCLAVATSNRPEGPFVDSGKPLVCGESFINIDPFAFLDPATGKRLLYWGSGFGPIKVQELGLDGLGFASGSSPIDLVAPIRNEDPSNYQRLVEGAWVVLRDGWYYLFFSGDNCCGPDAHYAVMVARSRSATGPFESRADATGSGNSVVIEQGGRWLAPGHNAVITDKAGEHWLLYHAVDRRHDRAAESDAPNSRRVMLLDRLVWRDGWPQVAGGVPSGGDTPAPGER
ncbi:hypothetical protein GCM10007973_12280 [Polymorphobacter multimanifer]|uniref:Arabinan endo-1,5-alpha-L-arabinosidase n=1 Tax=Polymorphobacter multimanifer TaxID=1070431 RepID=A0A841L5S6_9SPHN|nr:glycoside hydrolase family 43 protein [Polymorphobacter multimanifer]MBB6227780.1 arabinan endo-1,5-alpha-L-arabinosidase [Polymorphobacter multimanifer]GGI76967.1 hypothetical protein GCM10007973_12280 [Polymorphobacter multimanifer]